VLAWHLLCIGHCPWFVAGKDGVQGVQQEGCDVRWIQQLLHSPTMLANVAPFPSAQCPHAGTRNGWIFLSLLTAHLHVLAQLVQTLVAAQGWTIGFDLVYKVAE
jgi:hypothetical protein